MSTADLTALKSAIAALRLLIEEGSRRDEQLAHILEHNLKPQLVAIEERLRKVELELARHGGAAEVTGRILLQVPEKEAAKEEKKHETERWKATATIIVAVTSGIFGLISGLIALIKSMAEH